MTSDSQLPERGDDDTLITPGAEAPASHRTRNIVIAGSALALALAVFGVSSAMAGSQTPTSDTSAPAGYGQGYDAPDRSAPRTDAEGKTTDRGTCDGDGKKGEKPAGPPPQRDGERKPPADQKESSNES